MSQEDTENTANELTFIPANPIVVHQDNSAFPTGIMLDETNFSLWSQLMEMRIGARNKAGYLTGDNARPGPDDPRLESWITENHRVKSWLIESMTPSLMRRFIRLPTAREIWDAVSRTFYDGADETYFFELNQKSFTTKQNGRPLATYYNELVAIFQEIDCRTASQAGTVDGVLHLHSAMARLRLHIFLSGLDPVFNHIRGEILRKDPMLDLEGAYACVRREHHQKLVMDGSSPVLAESTVMFAKSHRSERERGFGMLSGGNGGEREATKGNGSEREPAKGYGGERRVFYPGSESGGERKIFNPGSEKSVFNPAIKKTSGLICNHCGEMGHSKQRCYEIIGYPDWWDFKKKPRKIFGKNMVNLTEVEPRQPTANAVHSGHCNPEDSWLWC